MVNMMTMTLLYGKPFYSLFLCQHHQELLFIQKYKKVCMPHISCIELFTSYNSAFSITSRRASAPKFLRTCVDKINIGSVIIQKTILWLLKANI